MTLRYLGTAVNQSKEIAQKVKADTGTTIEYIPVTTDDVSKRIITQPGSFDIVDIEYFGAAKKVVADRQSPGMDEEDQARGEDLADLHHRKVSPA